MKKPRLFRFLYLVILVALCVSARAADPAGPVIALKAARLFDGKAKALVTNGVVIVQGDKIVDAGSNLPIPEAAQVIDLGDATLSPGFMDAHTHLTLDYYLDYRQQELDGFKKQISERALDASV